MSTKSISTIFKKQHAYMGRLGYLNNHSKRDFQLWLKYPRWECDWYWSFGSLTLMKGSYRPNQNVRDIEGWTHYNIQVMPYDLLSRADIWDVPFDQFEAEYIHEGMLAYYALNDIAERSLRDPMAGPNKTYPFSVSRYREKARKILNVDTIPRIIKSVFEVASWESWTPITFILNCISQRHHPEQVPFPNPFEIVKTVGVTVDDEPVQMKFNESGVFARIGDDEYQEPKGYLFGNVPGANQYVHILSDNPRIKESTYEWEKASRYSVFRSVIKAYRYVDLAPVDVGDHIKEVLQVAVEQIGDWKDPYS